jgi:hypothetical protein
MNLAMSNTSVKLKDTIKPNIKSITSDFHSLKRLLENIEVPRSIAGRTVYRKKYLLEPTLEFRL